MPQASTVVVAHGLSANNAIGLQPDQIWIIPVPPIPATPGWDQITVGAITATTVAFTNNTGGEGGATITINVLFVMPHTIMGPGTNGGYT